MKILSSKGKEKPCYLLTLAVFLALISFGCESADVLKLYSYDRDNPKPYVTPEGAEIQLRGDVVFLTATELAQKIKGRELSSLEVVDAYLSQIYTFNPMLNAVVTVDAQRARERAREADDALDKGEIWGPLHGVPITVKDHYATAGLTTTNGFPPLSDYVPEKDATVVARLKKAGAIILGKTNMPTLGMDAQTDNPIFGATNNPWDVEYTSGGSSGGSAAAVAAGLSPLGIGSDMAGSIRIPSHFCGVFGLKPTENMVSYKGSFPGLPEMDFVALRHLVCIGPIARSISDLKTVLSIIAGADTEDVNVPAIPIIYPQPEPLEELHIAWTDRFLDVPVSNETRLAMKAFVRKIAQRGCTVEEINHPDFDFEVAWETYVKLADMEAVGIGSPRLLRFLSFLSAPWYRHLFNGTTAYPYSYKKYLQALTKRDNLISQIERFLTEWDVWLCPVTTTTAFKHTQPVRWAGPIPIYKQPLYVDGQPLDYWTANCAYTMIFNLTGNPVVTMPVGHSKDGLPISVQVVGRRWQDARLLTLAEQLFRAGGVLKHPPGYGAEP